MQALLRSVAPIIAAEEELGGKAISGGWADVDQRKLENWSKVGQESVQSEVKQVWDDTYEEEYARLFRHVSIYFYLMRCNASLTSVTALGAAK